MNAETIEAIALLLTVLIGGGLGGVHTYRKVRNGGSSSSGILNLQVQRQISDLWEWHAKTDEDGVKVWYVRRSLERAIEKLADNIELQTRMLGKIDDRISWLEDHVVDGRGRGARDGGP